MVPDDVARIIAIAAVGAIFGSEHVVLGGTIGARGELRTRIVAMACDGLKNLS
ncbi:hypothetical protein [Paenirhodobacter populi]|uniref:hypothetical protein n=1 Tax=Paenirhodobacter populi TaxID=2306993 RepID=UPI0013E2C388|nr:hypothetical protein [Sinirhodobacter populi]